MNDDQIDAHLDAILRASGTALKHFTLAKPKDDMRAALRAAIAAPEAAEPVAPVAKIVMRDGEIVKAATYMPGLPDGEHELYVSAGQAGRDAVKARSQQFADRVRDGIADFAANNWPDRKHSLAEIESGIRAIEVNAGLIIAALSTTTGRAAE